MLGILVLVMVLASIVYSHCQIPCGIYGDPTRFDMLAEHITTLEKSLKQITDLSKQDKPNNYQIVRWVHNKDKHADELSHKVTCHFMAQPIKPVDKEKDKAYERYMKKLTLLHEMLVYAMKTDLSNIERLRTLLAEFQAVYFE